MARSFNQAIIMGNLTRDPELRTTPGGQSVASFAVATNRSWQDASGEKKEAVDFHEVVAWGKLGELANQYLSKGRKVLVVGRLQNNSWEKDGVKRTRTEIIASDISFLDSRGADGATGTGSSIGTDRPAPEAENQDPDAKSDAKTKKAKKSDDVVIEDLDEKDDINLDEIPF